MTAGGAPGAGLQPERTLLAWQRTALALLVLGLAVPRLAWPQFGVWTVLVAGLVATGAGLLLAGARRRYLHARRRTGGSAGQALDGRQVLLAATTALLLGLVAAGLVLSDGPPGR